MLKRIVAIGFFTLLMVSALAVVDVLPIEKAAGEVNAPYDLWNGIFDDIWGTDGTWELANTDSVTHMDITIVVNGDLIIHGGALSGGSLTLINCDLLINSTTDGEFSIILEGAANGGSLTVQDWDSDPSTPGDASNITAWNPDGNHRFGFIVESGASLSMQNSELHQCGWNATYPVQYQDAGLWIEANGVTMSGNKISDCYYGITLWKSQGTLPATTTTIENNRIEDCTLGIFINETQNPIVIDGNNITQIQQHAILGLEGEELTSTEILSDFTMQNNEISFCGLDYYFDYNPLEPDETVLYTTVYINGTTNPYIHNNKLFDNMADGIVILHINDMATFTDNNIKLYTGIGLYIDEAEDAYVANNVITGTTELADHPAMTCLGIILIDAINIVDIINNRIENLRYGLSLSGTLYWTSVGIYCVGSFDGIPNPIATIDLEIRDNYIYNTSGWAGIYASVGMFYQPTTVLIQNNDVIDAGLTIPTGVPTDPWRHWGEGMFIIGRNTTMTVENNNVYNTTWEGIAENGIWIDESAAIGTYQTTTVRYNNVTGVMMDPASTTSYGMLAVGNTILAEHNNVSDNGDSDWDLNTFGMYLYNVGGGSTTVNYNTVNGNEGVGLWVDEVEGGATTTVNYNTVIGNGDTGIIVYSDSATVEGNFANDNEFHGMAVSGDDLPPGIATITGNEALRNTESGIYFYGNITPPGSDVTITGNTISDNLQAGIYCVRASSGEISGNTANSNEDGLTTVIRSGGIGLISCSDLVLYNNIIHDNDITAGTNWPNGIFLSSVDNIVIRECDLDNNDYGIYSYGSAFNVLVENTTITNTGSGSDFYLTTNSHITTLSSDYNINDINIADGSSTLTCKWWLDVRVRYEGTPINGADVYINDSYGINDPNPGTTYFPMTQPFTTSNIGGEDGWVKWIPVTQFIQDSGGKDYRTPHDITGLYVDPTTDAEGSETPTLDIDQSVIVDLTNRPEVIDLIPSAPEVFRDDSIFITLNASDPDASDTEDMLTPYFEYWNVSSSNWETIYFVGTASYVNGPAPGGWWSIEFEPRVDADTGLYDFRAYVEDQEGIRSNVYYSYGAVNVMNNLPEVEGVTNSSASGTVYRGTSVDIWADGIDVEDIDESNGGWNAVIEYRLEGGIWDITDITTNAYDSVTENWKFTFSPDPTRPDPNPGPVDFRFGFQDTDGDWTSPPYELLDYIELLNNPPQQEDVSRSPTIVYRTETATIYINASDVEELEGDLDVQVYYRETPTSPWSQMNLSGTPAGTANWNIVEQMFTIEFNPPSDTTTGFYEFMVHIEDADGDVWETDPANYFTIQVLNNLPDATNLWSSANSVTRTQTITLYATGDDVEDDPSTLSVMFSYDKPGGGTTWDTSYFAGGGVGIWDAANSRFYCDFTPPMSPAEDNTGLYSFRVVFEDSATDTDEEIQTDLVDVLNYEPTIDDVQFSTTNMPASRDPAYLYVYITDIDLTDGLQTVEAWYEIDNDGNWQNTEITAINWVPAGGYYEIEFSPTQIGDYTFRINTTDELGAGDSEEPATEITVTIWLPHIDDVTFSSDQVGQDRTAYIYINLSHDDPAIDEMDFNSNDIVVEYQEDGTGVWLTDILGTPTWDSDAGAWRVSFSPTQGTNLAFYDFRVNVTDEYGEQDEFPDNTNPVEVIELKPQVDDVQATPDPVGQGRTTYIYINLSHDDPTIDEDEIGIVVQYRHEDDTSWSNFPDPPVWDPGANAFRIEFPNDPDTEIGSYDIYVQVTDPAPFSESDEDTSNDLFEIILIRPQIDNVFFRPNEIVAGNPIYIFVNASEPDDPDMDEMDIGIAIWYQLNQSGVTPNDPVQITPVEYSSSGEYHWARFQLPAQTDYDTYDIRVVATDSYGKSRERFYSQAVNILNPEPEIIDFNPGAKKVNRGQTAYLFLNCSDEVDNEDDLTIEIRYALKDTNDWTPIGGISSDDHYEGSAPEGYWAIPFTPPTDLDLGEYKFKVTVINNLDGLAENIYDTSEYLIEVLNNAPEASEPFIIGSDTVGRGGSIVIYAEGTDVEDGTVDSTGEANFVYRFGTEAWSSTYLSTPSYDPSSGRWTVKFEPERLADTGSYDFQVGFKDSDGESGEPVFVSGLVEVVGSRPEVLDITLESNEVNRGETVYIKANGNDYEDDESQLTPTFQYSNDGGNSWKTEYLADNANYHDTYWRIAFTPPKGADPGNYKFQVRFQDKDGNLSDWKETTGIVEVLNNAPTAEIVDPTLDDVDIIVGESVSFTANVEDYEDDASDLTYEWDFDADGTVDSTSPTPTYTFESSGLKTVKLTVTDDNGDSVEDTLQINVVKESTADGGVGGLDLMTLLLILIPLIVVVLLLVFLLMRKKKSEEEVPGAAPPAEPAAPAVAPPAAPVAPAAPAAAVVAPAAAPKEAAKAGQKIKCPKCATAFTVESTERPIEIECPNCGAKGKLT